MLLCSRGQLNVGELSVNCTVICNAHDSLTILYSNIQYNNMFPWPALQSVLLHGSVNSHAELKALSLVFS